MKLGNYKKIRLTPKELEEVSLQISTVPEESREDIRVSLLQNIWIRHLDDIFIGTVPGDQSDERAEQMLGAFMQQLAMNNLKIEDYYSDTKSDKKKLLADFKQEAAKQLHTRMALYELAKAEKLTAREEEVEAEIMRLSDMYMMTPERLKEILSGREGDKLRKDIAVAKAADFVGELVRKNYSPT